jgi:hypothetical protein
LTMLRYSHETVKISNNPFLDTGSPFHLPHGRVIGTALPYPLAYMASNPPSEGVPDPGRTLGHAGQICGYQ